jgi:hypothetical protein
MADDMITIDTPWLKIPVIYSLGEVVYHRLAESPRRGLVTGIQLRPTGCSYLVTWPDQGELAHYAMELSTEFVPDYESCE